MRFKTIFLIFALAMFMLAGVAWAEDDDQGEDYGADASIMKLDGDGWHCYGLFALPDGRFVQFMVNSSEQEKLEEKVADALVKYERKDGVLQFMICGTGEAACVAPGADTEAPQCDGASCDEAVADVIAEACGAACKVDYYEYKLTNVIVTGQ